MLGRIRSLLMVLLTLVACDVWAQHIPDSSLEAAVRVFTPQSVVQRQTDPSDTVNVQFMRADLDGSGRFNYIVAAYIVQYGGKLLVLREVNSKLELAGAIEPSADDNIDTSNVIQMRLEDIDGDGRPEILIETYGSRTDYALDIFKWTGHSLVSLLSGDFETENASLEDLDHNGKLALVVPPPCHSADPNAACEGVFKVYKFDGKVFKLAFTSAGDPTNPTGSSGQPQEIFAFRALLQPSEFDLKDVLRALREHDEDGRVKVALGNLLSLSPGGSSQADAANIDATSLILGRTIKPLRTQLRRGEETDSDHRDEDEHEHGKRPTGRFQGAFLEAQFSRQAVLALVPKAQMDKPLAPGDVVTLDLTGKMKNGAPLHAFVSVLIKGEHDRDKDKHRDKD